MGITERVIASNFVIYYTCTSVIENFLCYCFKNAGIV